MSKLIGLFCILLISLHTWCYGQDMAIENRLNGQWNFVGSEYDKSYYPVNEWNKDTLAIYENYSFTNYFATQIRNQNYIQRFQGNWLFSSEDSLLIFFRDGDRYLSDLELKTVYKQFKLISVTDQFLALLDYSNNPHELYIYSKNLPITNYQEDLAQFMKQQLEKDYVLDKLHYRLNIDSSSFTKPYQLANYSFYYYSGNYPFETKTKHISGKINSIDSDKIRLSHYQINEKKSKTERYFQDITTFIKRPQKDIFELNKDKIISMQLPKTTVGKKASLYLAVASAFTTVVISPIIGLASKKENRIKNGFMTAGIGILGIGIGTGGYFIFDMLQWKPKYQKAKGVDLQPIYNRK